MLKSGKIDNLSTTLGCVNKFSKPSTSGWFTATNAAPIAPIIATKNNKKSVYTTPLNPPIALKITVTTEAIPIV